MNQKQKHYSPFGGGSKHGHKGMMVEKPKDFKRTLKRFLHYLKPFRFQLIFVMIAAILSTVFTIISPKLIGNITTILFDGFIAKMNQSSTQTIDFEAIGNILIVLTSLYLFSSIFNYVQQYIMAGIAQKSIYQLRKEAFEKLNRLPIRYFDSRTHGETLSRIIHDIDNISSTLQQNLTQMITSLVTLIGVTIMMFTISPLLTLIVLCTLPPSVLVTKAIAKRSQPYFKKQQQALGHLNGHVEEMYTGHAIVKAFNREEKSLETFNTLNQTLYESGKKAQFISGFIMPLMGFINNVGYVLISVVGGILVTQRTIQVGDIQAFIQYAKQFSHPITQVANIANLIQSTIASAERVFEVLDKKEEIRDEKEAKELNNVQGNVTFDHVQFSYTKGQPLIHELTVHVKTGQKVAIVGPTGAGKTTLVNLLMRFYEIDNGSITIDGIDIRHLKRHHLHDLFGMVLQDTWLFNGTIRDNIAYGKENATDGEIINAAKMANADSFIRTLPDGYDTILNEEASNISQGQKQLLTIARAILKNPPLLILDEATSSVDTRTEVQIQQAMNELMKGRTSFVIAHRLSTIQDADLILVMKDGDVIESGTHKALVKKDGFYAELYQSQFAKNDAI